MAQDTVRAIKPSLLLIPSKNSMPRSLELLWGENCSGKSTAHRGVTALQPTDLGAAGQAQSLWDRSLWEVGGLAL